MKKLNYATLIFLLAAGGACVADKAPPSLGRLLRKQHRQEKKTVKVLTNDDVNTVRPDTQTQTTKPGTAVSYPRLLHPRHPQKARRRRKTQRRKPQRRNPPRKIRLK